MNSKPSAVARAVIHRQQLKYRLRAVFFFSSHTYSARWFCGNMRICIQRRSTNRLCGGVAWCLGDRLHYTFGVWGFVAKGEQPLLGLCASRWVHVPGLPGPYFPPFWYLV